MLLYSHIWDALLKVTSLFALVILAIHWDLDQRLHSVALMIATLTLVWILVYRQYLSIVASWLYVRATLRTRVTFAEAKALRKLFQLDLSGKWIPLREIKALPDEQRHGALLSALDRFGVERKALLL